MYSHPHAHDDDFLFEQQRDPSDPRFRPVEYDAAPPVTQPATSTASRNESLSHALSQELRHATLQPITVDIKGAARLLCTSAWQVRQLIYSGQLHAFKLGKKYLLHVSDVKEFVDEKARQAGQD